jgi:hypothetical protein
MTYCVEVKANDRKCACKSGKSSKCPNDDKQIAKGTRARSPFKPSRTFRAKSRPLTSTRLPAGDIRFGATHETADGHKQTVWRVRSRPRSPLDTRAARICAPPRVAPRRV